MIIYLVGFMGSGKTYTGKLLAGELGLPHVDLDQWIEEKYDKSISAIFESEGEEGFREKETLALSELNRLFAIENEDNTSERSVRLIVSTGGGAPCFNGNMDWMNHHGLTIWLNPPVETLLKRLEKEKDHRPLLSGLSKEDMRRFIECKLDERTSFYGKALLKLDQENIDIKTLINSIKHAQNIQ
jgi:shikimate kinase